MIEGNPFLRPLDKVIHISYCTGEKFLVEMSRIAHPTEAERAYLYEVKRTAACDVLFGSFLTTESDDLGDLCFTQHQVLNIIGQDTSLFDDDTLTHLFLLKERGVFIVLTLYAEWGELVYDSEELRFFEIDEERIGKCLLYIPALAIG